MNYFIPENIKDSDPDTLRQGRLVVSMALIEALAASVYGLTYVAVGMYVGALCCFGASAIAAGVLFYFRKTGNIYRSGHALGFVPFAALLGICSASGALYAPGLGWFMLCPIIPSMINGRRAGVPWAAVSLVYFCVVLGLELAGVHIPNEVPAWFQEILFTMVPSGLVLVAFAIAWSYETAKDDAFARIREASRAVEAARDEARQAHQAARMVLDNVAEGMVLVGADGKIGGEHSAALRAWFGPQPAGRPIWEVFAEKAPTFSTWLELGWDDLADGFMPMELLIDQLPSRIQLGDKHLQVSYRPLTDDSGELEHVLVVVSDITAELEAERAEEIQKETMTIFLRLLNDRRSVVDFLDEARALVASVVGGEGSAAQDARWIHTLKGNAGLFGLSTMARWLHGLEDRLGEQPGCTDADRAALQEQWDAVEARLRPLLSEETADQLVVLRKDFDALLSLTRSTAAGAPFAAMLERWTWDPAARRVERLAEQAGALAERLGKPDVSIEVDTDDLRLPPDPKWAAFWCSLSHTVRNALDHGIEPAEERPGKAGAGTLRLRACRDGAAVLIEISDDGRGIAWDKITQRAAGLGLPTETEADRIRALFADGLSTRDTVTEVSGRGVGTGAVWAACSALGGEITVDSTPGEGATFRFRLPLPLHHRAAA